MRNLTVGLVVAGLLLASCASDPNATGSDARPNAPDGIGSSSLGISKSGTRIKMRVGRTSDGAAEHLGWYDAQLSALCAFQRAGDGKTRCIPGLGARRSASEDFYSDAACTAKLAARGNCAAFPPVEPYATELGFDCVLFISAVYHLGPKHTGSVYQKTSTQPCVALLPAQIASTDFYALGAPMALTEFVERTETVE